MLLITSLPPFVSTILQYDGEKDARAPSDFTGNAPNNKLDDTGEGDDEDLDDYEPAPSRSKRRVEGKLKADFSSPPKLQATGQGSSDMAMGLDVSYSLPHPLSSDDPTLPR
jgi:hypothetical protein